MKESRRKLKGMGVCDNLSQYIDSSPHDTLLLMFRHHLHRSSLSLTELEEWTDENDDNEKTFLTHLVKEASTSTTTASLDPSFSAVENFTLWQLSSYELADTRSENFNIFLQTADSYIGSDTATTTKIRSSA